MNTIEIKFKRTSSLAKLPTVAHPDPLTGDTGYDVYCSERTEIPTGHHTPYKVYDLGHSIESLNVGFNVVPTGIIVADITPRYWFRVEGKSGLGFKYHLFPHPGIIDNSYRGDLGIKIYNLGPTPYIFEVGDKVAQLVFYPLIRATVSWSEEINSTLRGENGFGSTGR